MRGVLLDEARIVLVGKVEVGAVKVGVGAAGGKRPDDAAIGGVEAVERRDAARGDQVGVGVRRFVDGVDVAVGIEVSVTLQIEVKMTGDTHNQSQGELGERPVPEVSDELGKT